MRIPSKSDLGNDPKCIIPVVFEAKGIHEPCGNISGWEKSGSRWQGRCLAAESELALEQQGTIEPNQCVNDISSDHLSTPESEIASGRI